VLTHPCRSHLTDEDLSVGPRAFGATRAGYPASLAQDETEQRDSLGLRMWRRGRGSRDRQDGRALDALRLALGFDFADEHGGSDRADGDGAGLCAALAVEDFGVVAGGEDALHGG